MKVTECVRCGYCCHKATCSSGQIMANDIGVDASSGCRFFWILGSEKQRVYWPPVMECPGISESEQGAERSLER